MDQITFDFELNREERMIIDILQTCKGKEAAILGAKIADLTGITYVEVRQTISHLVNEHHCRIASCSRGYYVPMTPDEVDAAYKSMRHRGISILVRAANLQKISLEEVYQQGKLEFEGGLNVL
ncbi:MAG: hypothetical protein C4560_02980 [Nitrospiraceae bacterium]|nr:MAG: hypothetical protein C4560_02980 [Nitrospiraceae bacterium]